MKTLSYTTICRSRRWSSRIRYPTRTLYENAVQERIEQQQQRSEQVRRISSAAIDKVKDVDPMDDDQDQGEKGEGDSGVDVHECDKLMIQPKSERCRPAVGGHNQQSNDPINPYYVRRRTYNSTTKKWSPWKVLWYRPDCKEQNDGSQCVTAFFNDDNNAHIYQNPSRMSMKHTFCRTGSDSGTMVPIVTISFRKGGSMRIYPKIMEYVWPLTSQRNQQQTPGSSSNGNRSVVDDVKDEILLQCPFRQYKIQGVHEPRVQFLAHARATQKPDEQPKAAQPGYRYSPVTLRGRPLQQFPLLQQMAAFMATVVTTEHETTIQEDGMNQDTASNKNMSIQPDDNYWNIGVHVVAYRDGSDKQGMHADDDQGEQKIMCLILASPTKARRIRIIEQGNKEHGQEEFELYLISGDAYEMDAQMQLHYLHGVPSASRLLQRDTGSKQVEASTIRTTTMTASHESTVNHANSPFQRIVAVFRRGEQKWYMHDSGKPVDDLKPKQPQKRWFGDQSDQLQIGRLYRREELFKWNFHLQHQAGISGSKRMGCDAIIVGNINDSFPGTYETSRRFGYMASRNNGALSMDVSMEKWFPVRVFRTCAKSKSKTSNYLYKGLYFITGRSETKLYRKGVRCPQNMAFIYHMCKASLCRANPAFRRQMSQIPSEIKMKANKVK